MACTTSSGQELSRTVGRSRAQLEQAISIPIISHDNRQMRSDNINHLQPEIMVRRRDDVNGEEARFVSRQDLLWADENSETDLLHKSAVDHRWMWIIEESASVSELPIRRCSCATASYSDSGSLREFASFEKQALTWEPSSISDVNHVCHAIGRMVQAAWNGLLLVPAEQMTVVTSLFRFVENFHDAHLQRDAVSVLVDSLMRLDDRRTRLPPAPVARGSELGAGDVRGRRLGLVRADELGLQLPARGDVMSSISKITQILLHWQYEGAPPPRPAVPAEVGPNRPGLRRCD